VYKVKSIKLVVLLCSLASLGWSQYGTGTILGTITDPTGAVVVGGTVTAKNLDTDESRSFTSDEAGNYQFNALPPGTYSVTAAAPSFKTGVVSKVEVYNRFEEDNQITRGPEGVYARPSDRPGFGWDIEVT
jgi:hypothetical protein